MKKYFFISLSLIALLFTACDKDDDEAGTATYLKMKIDNGNEISFDVTSNILGTQINITGTKDSKSLQFQVPEDAVEGDVDTFIIYYSENDETVFSTYNITDKNLHITKNDAMEKRMTGTFSVDYNDDLQNTHTATGSFDIKY